MSKIDSKDMCPGREHMNGPMPHAFENGLCLFCKQARGKEAPEVIELCMICGDDVFPGSGKWIDRVPSLDTVKEREENDYPYPLGDFICAECAGAPPEELPND